MCVGVCVGRVGTNVTKYVCVCGRSWNECVCVYVSVCVSVWCMCASVCVCGKSWNECVCVCVCVCVGGVDLAGLPCHQNSQLHNIHFIACSNKVDCMEMSGAIVSDGIVMYDSTLKQNVLVFAPVIAAVIAALADNPRLTWEVVQTSFVVCVW